MSWVLITGGVCSDIGKGTSGAVLGRLLARSGLAASYRKIEPCLQGELESLTHRAFGEVVLQPDGVAFDSDVARASFLIPGFVPNAASDLSLGRAIGRLLDRAWADRAPSPRLREVADDLRNLVDSASAVTIVEVGGTAGEAEHRLVADALLRALGRPSLHVHVTAILARPGGGATTKPAQLASSQLSLPPDLVLVRTPDGVESLTELASSLPRGCPCVPVSEDLAWPERAFARALSTTEISALVRTRLCVSIEADPSLASSPVHRVRVQVLDDGAGPSGYASLCRRLTHWSGGRLDVRFVDGNSVASDQPLIRIGEHPPAIAATEPDVPRIEIVPTEAGGAPRSWAHRPDWHGTADAPEGPVGDFVRRVLEWRRSAAEAKKAIAYAEPRFASRYLSESREGRLRDHSIMDPLVMAALPCHSRLESMRLLDIGCGDGRWSARFVELGAREVVGVEPATPMADAAAARDLPRFALLRDSIESVDLPGKFDFVLASMSLDHVASIRDALCKIAAAMQPLGTLFFSTEHPMRTAARTGPRWLVESQGARAARVRDYGEPGWRTMRWFGLETPVAVYHRKIESWLEAIRSAGLEVEHIHEPVAEEERDGGVPRFWAVAARKPGPRRPIIVVDGRSSSGKSTLASGLAEALNWTNIDTGRIARAYAWQVLERPSATSSIQVSRRGRELEFMSAEESITALLDDPKLAARIPDVLSRPGGYEGLDRLTWEVIQRFESDGIVVVGRGMARCLPEALASFWLDARVDVRAQRRGVPAATLEARDEADARAGRLLGPSPRAVRLDTTSSTREAALHAALRLVRDSAWTLTGEMPPMSLDTSHGLLS